MACSPGKSHIEGEAGPILSVCLEFAICVQTLMGVSG